MKFAEFITESEKRMSRAAKGNEKYGKEGMKALAKAGRDGASEKTLDTIRDKYNKYDESVEKSFNGEYDDEAGMAQGNLYTIAQAAKGLLDTIDDQDNLPEWVQEKIAKVEGMLVNVWNYLQSQKAQGIDPKINESAAWRRKEGKSRTGGLNKKGVASYRRENPGSKLQTAVTTKPSKLKPGSKAAKRRKSFCARMGGVKGPMKKPNGKPTRKALALRKWNCESVEQLENMLTLAESWAKEKGVL